MPARTGRYPPPIDARGTTLRYLAAGFSLPFAPRPRPSTSCRGRASSGNGDRGDGHEPDPQGQRPGVPPLRRSHGRVSQRGRATRDPRGILLLARRRGHRGPRPGAAETAAAAARIVCRARRRPQPHAEDLASGVGDSVRLYLQEIGDTELLTMQEEVWLAKRIERGKLAEERLCSPELDLARRARCSTPTSSTESWRAPI